MKRALTILLATALIFESVMPHTFVYASEAEQEIISGDILEETLDTGITLEETPVTDQLENNNSEADHEAADESVPAEDLDSSEPSLSSAEDTQVFDEDTADSEAEPAEEDLEEVFLQPTLLNEGTEAGNSLAQLGLIVNNNTIKINSEADLILLSNCAPMYYQNLTVNMPVSGTLDITGTASHDGMNYTFQGFGSSEYPFAGTFSGSGVTLTTNRTLFNGLSSTASLNSQKVEWKGTTSQPMLATEYFFEDGGEHSFPIQVTIAADNTGVHNGYIAGNLIDKIVKSSLNTGTAGTLSIGSTAVNYNTDNNPNTIEITNDVNSGLICNTLEAGTLKLTDFGYPSSFKVTASTGSAGGLIGKMGNDTKLEVTNTRSVITSTTITGVQNAGGIVGEGEVAEVILNNCNINSTLSATDGSVGGIIGAATDLKVTSTNVIVNSLTATGVNAGGLFGSYQQSKNYTFAPVEGITIPNQVSLNGSNAAGGLFGYVTLSDRARLTVGNENNASIITLLSGNTLGGIAGQVVGASTTNTLTINNYSVTYSKTGEPAYLGGVAGMLGEDGDNRKAAALVINGVTTSTGTPSATNAKDRNFGGIVGRLADGSVLDAKNLTIITTGNITGGGAVVGNARPGSVVRFSKVTDLSGAKYKESADEGQIIGYQDSALVYALGSGSDYDDDNDSGWTLKRSTTQYALDDIGNYGEVFRLKATSESPQGLGTTLIQMDEDTYKVSLSGSINYAQIATPDDFALLAITWQTKGYFSGDPSITKDNWSTLNTKDITITGNISLVGTGVTGFTRDDDMGSSYEGKIDGKDNTITLAIGEAYGMRGNEAVTNDAKGSGKIYRHGRLGLFATDKGTISNLKIAGKIEAYAKSEMAIGSFSGYVVGEQIIDNVETRCNITVGSDGSKVYVGGLYGKVEKGSGNICMGDKYQVQTLSTITVLAGSNCSFMCVGGAAGFANAGTKFQVNNLKIGGTITDNRDQADTTFLAGGFIGVITANNVTEESEITVKKILIDGFSLTTNAGSWTGGVLGAFWANTNLQNAENGKEYAIEVKNGSISAPNTKYMGGMVYSAGGKWEFGDYAVDLSGLNLSGGTISTGLMVHDGYDSAMSSGLLKNVNPGAIYLLLKAHWDSNAYRVAVVGGNKVTQSNMPEYYDEFVARTSNNNNIMASNLNGVISLKTNDSTVIMNGVNINTYCNRTDVGITKNTNPYSRYYYNLDCVMDSVSDASNNWVDTPQELMIWSVRTYAKNNLKKYFTKGDSSKENIGYSETNITFDMKGYSYYPVDVYNQNLNVKNATFKFYNKEIESGENNQSNKNTSNKTQHQAMHCGLLHDYKRYGMDSTTRKDFVLTVDNVRFQGTVGRFDNKSGALCCGTIQGASDTLGAVTYSVSVNNCILDGVIVYNANKNVAPVLINSAKSYTSLVLANVSSFDESYIDASNNVVEAGSSLIGTVGGETETQVTVSFTNISLTSGKTNSIFTRASLMESFGYNKSNGIGSAIYNFNKTDNITYGAEIDNLGEYISSKQPEEPYYYDTDECITDGEITAAKGQEHFKEKYLPYIKDGYQEDSWKHDIKVNHRVVNITEGCGTYGHPYQITEPGQLAAIASYIENGTAGAGWQVTIASSQERLCRKLVNGESLDKTYVFKGTNWVNINDPTDTFTNDNMHLYIKNAYFDICKDITLNNFKGLGTKSNPFRGVLVSTGGKIITLKQNSGMCSGLIPYSYGSVVKDLKIVYEGTNTLSFSAGDKISNGAFFGGVFGCILGGDNIIDNVQVSANKSFISFDSNNKHLITVGGYIGSIVGGGVIFRNIMTGNSGMTDDWLTGTGMSVAEDAKQSLYVNPFLGRMLDGYAFSEGCKVENTNKNYKINQLDPNQEKGVVTTGLVKHNDSSNNNVATTTTVKTAQGMLVLSAIFNSGAANATFLAQDNSTNAYYYGSRGAQYGRKLGTYEFGNKKSGKVRNAQYNHIGEPETDQGDFNISVLDDRLAPGYSTNNYWGNDTKITDDMANTANLPYLVTKYSTKSTAYICSPGVSYWFLKFEANADLDLKNYGNGYLGFMPRYDVNAANAGTATNAYDRITQYLVCVDGGNATIKVDLNSMEYVDDEYHTLGVGAVFSAVSFCDAGKQGTFSMTGGNRIQNLTIKDSSIALSYYDNSGNPKTVDDIQYINDQNSIYYKYSDNFKKNIGVGGFAGLTKNYQSNYVAQITSFKADNLIISSPQTAGTIFGNVGNAEHNTGNMYSFSANTMTPILVDCSYTNTYITGGNYVGGFIGNVTASQDVGKDISVNVTDNNYSKSSNSEILSIGSTANANYVGGCFGYVNRNVKINDQDYKILNNSISLNYSNEGKTLYNLNLEGVSVKGGGNGGGIIGGMSPIISSTINKVTLNNVNVQSKYYSGGVLGSVNSNKNADCAISDVEIKAPDGSKVQIGVTDFNETSGDYGYGGIVAAYDVPSGKVSLNNCSVENAKINYCLVNGGMIGYVKNTSSITVVNDCVVKNSIIEGKIAGGAIGCMNKKLYGSNILLANNTIKDKDGLDQKKNNRAYLIGANGTNTNEAEIYVAGLSVQQGDEGNPVVPVVGVPKDSTSTSTDSYTGYIAFADYTGACLTNDGSGNLLGTEQKYPYAATSPISAVKVKESAGAEEVFLYSDGAAWKSEKVHGADNKEKTVFTSNVETIYRDSINPSSSRFRYLKTGVNTPLTFSNMMSTYCTEQNAVGQQDGSTKPTTVINDFPILKISSGSTSTITDCLNIITNGGYAKALNKCPDHVGVSVSQYKWNGTAFVKEVNNKPALRVLGSKTSAVSFVTTPEYDNGLDRFNLVTVTFTEEGEKYQVQIPVIVRRLLEIDFTATLDYGTNFNPASYIGLTNHILESYGNSITAYLTYTYNHAKGHKEEYGWKNYVESGGDMTEILEKAIVFEQADTNLPSGTQLTLINPATDQAYYYKTTEEDSAKKVISFASFVDSSGNPYSSRVLGDIMQVSVIADKNGKFVEEKTNPADATICYQENNQKKYYRLANPDEKGTHTVIINEAEFTKNQMTENYFLVITVPKGNTAPANGYLTTRLSGNVPNNINCLKIDGTDDGHANTASTYNLSEGYQQTLRDSYEPENGDYVKEITAEDSTISIQITDTVSFPNSQIYNDTDGLYQRFIANIQSHINQAGTDIVKSEQFPSGSSGTVSFYVKAGESYWTGSELSDSEAILSSYDWVSKGANLELPLADREGTLIDLANLRKTLKGSQETGTSSFTIEAKIDVNIPTVGLDVIPESTLEAQGQPKNFAQLAFTAQISNDGNTLSYSSTKVNVNGNMKYYRASAMGSKLIYNADEIDQLGINLHDLQSDYMNVSKTASRIVTTVEYDLSDMENLESVLKNSDRVEFSLDLRGRNSDDLGLGYPEQCYSDAANYISIVPNGDYSLDETGGVWSMTIPKSEYIDQNGNLKTDGVFDGGGFKFSIDIWVRVDNIEASGHLYDNYKVTLNAKLLSGDQVVDQPESDNIIYTLCKIRPEFIFASSAQ